MQLKRRLRAEPIRHVRRFHLLSCFQTVQRSNYYPVRIHHISHIQNFRLPIQDLHRICLNHCLRTCWTAFGISFAAQERWCHESCKCTFVVANVAQNRSTTSSSDSKTFERIPRSSRRSSVPYILASSCYPNSSRLQGRISSQSV